MAEIIKAPAIRHYMHWLRNAGSTFSKEMTYDEKSYPLMDELYQELRKVAPCGDRNLRELWLKSDRGTLADLGDMDELIADGEFESEEEARSYWEDMFPDQEYWYLLQAIEDDDTGYRAIFVGHEFLIEIDPRHQKSSLIYDISEFVQWILHEVKRCVVELEAGIYNDNVRKNLPAKHRTGTITRKALYDIFPEERTDLFQNLSVEDKLAFITCATEAMPEKRLPTMTANDFYQFCSYGYEANGYKGADRTPVEQYYLHADGRDDELREIDPDSPEAFRQWLIERKYRGGHPWEVCRGGNSTHISLYVSNDEDGYYLTLAGSSVCRTIETVKFYLALQRKGLPVRLREAAVLVERLQETEKIGIVPEGIWPAFCEGMFPGEHIIAFRNLPNEQQADVVQHCVWQEVREIHLK